MDTNEEQEKELGDVVREAMAEAEDTSKEEAGGDQERDASGKFVAKAGESEVDAAKRLEPDKDKETKPPEQGADPAKTQEGASKETERLLNKDVAPTGWTPAAREKWATLPDDIRAEILRREEASAVGVRQLQERFAPVEQFVSGLAPYINEAINSGVNPSQYIAGVLNTERALRTGSVPDRFQAILAIADQYGVPLRDVINQSVGAQIIPPAQQQQSYVPPEVMQELQAMRAWREQQDSNNVNSNIAAFAQGKEFFNDVRNVMANLIESGEATDLQQAYDDACWAVPAVRTVLLSRQGQQQQNDELKNRQQAAAGASLKPGSESDILEDEDKEDDDIGDTVRKAYARSVSGRV